MELDCLCTLVLRTMCMSLSSWFSLCCWNFVIEFHSGILCAMLSLLHIKQLVGVKNISFSSENVHLVLCYFTTNKT